MSLSGKDRDALVEALVEAPLPWNFFTDPDAVVGTVIDTLAPTVVDMLKREFLIGLEAGHAEALEKVDPA